MLVYTFGSFVLECPRDYSMSLLDLNAVHTFLEVLVIYSDVIFGNKKLSAQEFKANQSKISSKRPMMLSTRSEGIEISDTKLASDEETKALREELTALKRNFDQVQASQFQWGKSIQTILMATVFSPASSAKYLKTVQSYLVTKVTDLTSKIGLDDPRIEVSKLELPVKNEELPYLQLIKYDEVEGIQWLLDWKAHSFVMDLHLEGRKVVKFKSNISIVNLFVAGVIWMKILPDGSLTVCFPELPSVSFDLNVETKVGMVHVSIESQVKKWLNDKLRSFLKKSLVHPNWKVLKK